MNKTGENFFARLAGFIVEKRKLFFLISIIGLIFTAFSRNWVEVENDLIYYLPDKSEAKCGIDLMEKEFTTFGSAQLMVANITYADAEALCEEIENIQGVGSVDFDDTQEHYNRSSALFTVTFDYDEDDEKCLEILDNVKDFLSGYDLFCKTDLGNVKGDILADEVKVVIAYIAVIILAVLLLTSDTYAEIPVLIITFVNAIVLNIGTDFLLGKISFVSNSVTSILQLALSLDYAIILCNRYKEERKVLPIKEAVTSALGKAIPEIGASCLTTLGGLAAMLFMQFKLGPDMSICLIKSIVFALLSVFLLMPGLLVLFGPLMDKSAHKSFVPKISFAGKFAYATRYFVPILFIAAIPFAVILSRRCPFVYGYGNLETPTLNYVQEAENLIADTFEDENKLAIVVPKSSYENEKAFLSYIEEHEEVIRTQGIANSEAMDGYTLTDKLNAREFSELAELDYDSAQLLYTAYAADKEELPKLVNGIPSYTVPLMDMFSFVCEQSDEGLFELDADKKEELDDAKKKIDDAKLQLIGENYSRMLVYIDLPVSGDETYEFIDTLRNDARLFYPDGEIFVVGESTNEYDFKKSFSRDNKVVSVVSILIVLAVLLFTFKSAAMPLLLILIIQGSIFINYSIPALMNKPLFFLSYLIVSAIQMGANIDYAIVIASRYNESRKIFSTRREAVIDTLNFAFPTILTSGLILATAGTLIGNMTSEAGIAGIGQSLGRGTVISMVLVMFVLPQILLLGEKLVEHTKFDSHRGERRKSESGRVFIDGTVVGRISGNVTGYVRAAVDGEVDVNVVAGNVGKEENTENENK